jgi:prepilin-type N-terminal cleavage/methylation domain-containing protein
MKKRKKSEKSMDGQSGFTLVEVLIAVAVLAFGLLSIAASFTQGMLILANTPIQLAAKELAFEIIDDYVMRRDASIPITLNFTGKEITTHDGRVFSVTAGEAPASTYCADDYPDSTTEVKITVSYCQGHGISCVGTARERKYNVTACID